MDNLAKRVRLASVRVGLPLSWVLNCVKINRSLFELWAKDEFNPSKPNEEKLNRALKVLEYFYKIQQGGGCLDA